MKIAMMSYTLARGPWGKDPDIAALCRLTRELGLDAIDWVTTYGKSAREIRAVTDDFGLKNICYTFFARVQAPDAVERRAALDTVREGIENAVALGADKIMLPIPGLPGVPRDETRRYALDGLAGAVELGKAAGITVTMEHFPGAGSPFAISADMNEAVRAVPGLKVTYDNGNVAIGGEAAPDGYRNSRDDVVHAHFKDWRLAEEGMLGLDGHTYQGALVGEGVVKPLPCLQAMAAGGYQGYIDFEYEGNDYDVIEAMRKGIPPLQEMIAAVESGQ